MTLDEWRFSAKLAWQDRFVRWMTVATFALAFGMSVFVLWRLIPEGLRAGVLTMHYTIYLGIDDVRTWPWIFLLPAGMMSLMSVSVLCTFGLFRRDPLAAKTLSATLLASAVLWSFSVFFLIIVNA
jgi:hypothetical protein